MTFVNFPKEDEGRRPTRARRPSSRYKDDDDDDDGKENLLLVPNASDLTTTVRYRTRPRAKSAYGDDDENVPTRFSSRTGAKISYAESDDEFGADSKLSTEPIEYSAVPKVTLHQM